LIAIKTNNKLENQMFNRREIYLAIVSELNWP
jgi:ribosomal protein S24E